MSMKGPIVVTAAKNRQWAECTASVPPLPLNKNVYFWLYFFLQR